MAIELDPRRTLILWALIGKGGQACQKDIRPEIRKADRDVLVEQGLLRADTQDGVVRLEMTAQGWDWAQAHLTARLPANSTAGTQVLQDWLNRLAPFLESREVSLAQLLGQVPAPSAPHQPTDQDGARQSDPAGAAAQPAAAPPQKKADQPAAPPSEALFDRIRLTYLAITGGALDKPVRLHDLRERLRDLDPPTWTRVLLDFATTGRGCLDAIERDRALTDGDRKAAVILAGRARHVLTIPDGAGSAAPRATNRTNSHR